MGYKRDCISIIILVYDVSEYIERCIKSVICQTYKSIECVIVNDATPDDGIEKCKRLIDDYSGDMEFSILYHQLTE